MKSVLEKLASIATRLDMLNLEKEANAVDFIFYKFANLDVSLKDKILSLIYSIEENYHEEDSPYEVSWSAADILAEHDLIDKLNNQVDRLINFFTTDVKEKILETSDKILKEQQGPIRDFYWYWLNVVTDLADKGIAEGKYLETFVPDYDYYID